MNMRITTKAMISGYSRNLNQTMLNLNASRERVLTKRNFNKMSEDPGAATKAFQLRREYARNEDYIENVETIQSVFAGLEGGTDEINRVLQNINSEVLSAINGSTSIEGRETYAKSIDESMKAIVKSINATFGGKFIYGGKNTKEVPFELTEDGKLLYNNGLKDDGTGNMVPDKIDVNDPDPAVQAKLKDLANEGVFIDIGIGLKTDNNGDIIEDSAFNTAWSGLKILGFGGDISKGEPSKNVVTLMGQISAALRDPGFQDNEKFRELTDQYKICSDNVIDNLTQLGVKSQYLETTKNRLESDSDSLAEKIVSLENVDMAEAITDYSWQQYAYNAALKVGTSILSPSFIDFMN